jgi:hypothetical protein
MSVYRTTIEAQVATAVVSQTQSFPAGGAALAVETISSSATEVYAVVVDNSLNTEACYLKGFDTTAGVTEGIDKPHLILKADAGTKVQYSFDNGVSLTNGLKAMVTTTAVTAGVTAPASDVQIFYLVTVT